MSKRTRAVLVGCGGITRAWLGADTCKKKIELVGFVDIKKKAAREKASQHGIENAVVDTDLNSVLTKTNPDIVFNCTTPAAHCPVTLTALKHGCHVLSEKPMADSMVNARRMVNAARKAGKILAVTQNYRYNPMVRSLRRFLESEKLGKITTVHTQFTVGAHFKGFRAKMRHVLLMDMAIHSFDLARCISGADPKSVYCHEWNPRGSWLKHGASASAIFEMTNNIVYTYQGSWCAEGCRTSWNCAWRIICERGTVIWDGDDTFHAEIVNPKGKTWARHLKEVMVPVRAPKTFRRGHDGVMHDFLSAIKSGKDPETVCTDNIKSLAMVNGAIKSADARRRIVLG